MDHLYTWVKQNRTISNVFSDQTLSAARCTGQDKMGVKRLNLSCLVLPSLKAFDSSEVDRPGIRHCLGTPENVVFRFRAARLL